MSMVVPMGISVIEEKVKMELETMNCPSVSLIDDYFQHLDIASASGRIVSFDNDLVPFPFLELKANMEAQQDLHGYDHPWPEGGGRNQLDFTVDSVKALNTEGTWSGNAYTHLGVTFTIQTDSDGNVTGINVNGTSLSQSELSIMSSITLSSACILNSGSTDVRLRLWASGNIHVSKGTDVEVPAGTYTCEYVILSGDGAISKKVSTPMLRLATDSDSSYAPPSNICPISGWDEVNVYVGGEIFVNDDYSFVEGQSLTDTGEFTSPYSAYKRTDYIDVKNMQSARITINNSYASGWVHRLCAYDSSKNFVSLLDKHQFNTAIATYTYNADFSSVSYIAISLVKTNSSIEGMADITTYTVNFEDEVGTVYGGTLNLLTGVLTLTHGIADLYNRTWTYNSLNAWFYASMPSDSPTPKNYGYEGICDRYKVVQENSTVFKNDDMAICYCNLALSSSKRIFIRDSRYTDATAFKNSLNGSKLVYQLGTPQTVQLTAQDIKMLVGENNVWSDVGEVEVIYYTKES